MKRIAAFVFCMLAACVVGNCQSGIIHGNGDPRVITPTPNCASSRFYVDDSTSIMYVAGTGSPCTWTVEGASGGVWGGITGTLSSQTDLNTALGLKAPLASPALTGTPTAPTQTAGDNSTDLATDAFVNTAIAGAGAPPFTPLAAYYAVNASGTTLPDSSGNGFNCTFASGTNAPSIVNGNAIRFRPTAGLDQYMTCPFGALNGANTVMLFFRSQYPPSNEGGEVTPAILSDCNSTEFVAYPSRFGSFGMFTTGGNAEANEATDRLIGNAYVTAVNTGTWQMYPWGHIATSYIYSPGAQALNCGSGSLYIGHRFSTGASTTNVVSGGSGWSGDLYAILSFTQALTQAQVQQANAFVLAQLARVGVTFSEPTFPATLIYSGDSRTAFYPTYQVYGSRPFTISNLEADREQFFNFGRSGQTLATINAAFSAVEAPVLRRYASASETILLDAIINDAHTAACASGAACLTTINTYGTNVAAVAPGITSVYATPLPYNGMTSGQEAVREATEASVTAAALASPPTFTFTGVDDIYNDPLASTQSTPNVYATGGVAAINMVSGSATTATVLYRINLASAAPLAYCYSGAQVTIAGMTPSNYNGTFTIMSSNSAGVAASGNKTACLGAAFNIVIPGAAIGDGTVFGTAAFPNGAVIAVTAASKTPYAAQFPSLVTATLASAPPPYSCYPGAVWAFAGNTPAAFNTTVSLLTCSGTTITYVIAAPGTITVPGTATYQYNPQFYIDGIHENGILVQEMASQESASIKAAQGRMQTCTQITKTINYQVTSMTQATTAALTQTIPLIQLWPGWSVCSLSANISTAFSGSGIATLSGTIGDSGGTATQYANTFSLTSPGQVIPLTNAITNPATVNGMVNLYLTATGANIVNTAAGQMTISIGVIKP